MGTLRTFIGVTIAAVLQLAVFLFVIVATPISQFDVKNGSGCYTFIGYKTECSLSAVSATGTAAFGCKQRRDSMGSGAAFAIISILTTLAALVFIALMLLRIPCAVFPPLLFTCLSVFTILISWACVASVYSIRMCNDPFYRFVHYGPGFGLMVTAWCLQVINVVVLFMLFFG
ncbi:amastin-like surface protein-like protein [Leishmania major strain Friedlin]|uniref:Amastin-like surface protein-like protein n=1 Tax=Leishmania major TaxID=5664 RepID=Q4QAK6_LEIMA|nr:amastin-like surface protein-like protein [Leishmania major strain Friedlin]CAG9574596.1 amastin-like_surface_protein-like_protein [Leishmania major strain Friedlin]CAJ04926.1 amastin-like surface protein-like protein [Leishmania major strain Friedlin]|eukprot:XP_001683642.1 amastin-like surface protein-like protein [Leishmania major strain Friedlin]